MDLLQCALRKFELSCGGDAGEILPIMEISMHNLREDGNICLEDFVSRADVVSTTGCTVMISDFREYHRVAAYLSRYTDRPIGLAMGLTTLRSLFEERYYEDLDGGILESFGRLFKEQLKLLIYPLKNQATGEIECLDDVVLRIHCNTCPNILLIVNSLFHSRMCRRNIWTFSRLKYSI